MNNTAQALHAAARRYCYDRHRHWCELYAAMPKNDSAGSYRYSAKQKNVFPRYNILHAIRAAIEAVDPGRLDDFQATRQWLESLADSADDDFTLDPPDGIVRDAQDDERDKFSGFVRSLDEWNVWDYAIGPAIDPISEQDGGFDGPN